MLLEVAIPLLWLVFAACWLVPPVAMVARRTWKGIALAALWFWWLPLLAALAAVSTGAQDDLGFGFMVVLVLGWLPFLPVAAIKLLADVVERHRKRVLARLRDERDAEGVRETANRDEECRRRG